MKKIALILLLTSATAFIAVDDFLAEQKKFARVRTAISEKESGIKTLLSPLEITSANVQVLFVAYKEEKELQVFVKKVKDATYTKVKTYSICSSSGGLGPKRKAGDGQVPEGFYHVDRFNPNSNFYLSLGINYPNASDKKLGKSGSLGGDIFIHGNCVTIGCIPITDEQIKEAYLLAVYAKNNGQAKIPVYIFPFKMTDANMKKFEKENAGNTALIAFWKNLRTGYDAFIKNNKALTFSVNTTGEYTY
ncbi:MAG: L,D-transpeptidase family protein [Bacteroidia bacterium]